jgi:protein phosphatase
MPYDLIGDVHGCRDELLALLSKLGYQVRPASNPEVRPPAGRSAVFLGDLVNRGPDTPGVVRLVMGMLAAGSATCVAGNHDVALASALQGRKVEKIDALAASLQQLAGESQEFKQQLIDLVGSLPRRLSLDGGRLIVAHAGLPHEYHRSDSAEADDFAVNGREVAGPNGETVRYRWAEDYRGDATVVYGHYSQLEATWLNRTICLDTGCVYGGRLTALRYPEGELVSVPAARVYYESRRSQAFRAAALAAGA